MRYNVKQAKIEGITYCKRNEGCYGKDGSCGLSSEGETPCKYLNTNQTTKKMMYSSPEGRIEHTLFGCGFKRT